MLQILGVFEWSGSNPMPPEFWILPSFLPMHPGNSRVKLISGFVPNWLNFYLKIVYVINNSPRKKKNLCSENVVLLSNGLHANVVFVREEICWSDHASNS